MHPGTSHRYYSRPLQHPCWIPWNTRIRRVTRNTAAAVVAVVLHCRPLPSQTHLMILLPLQKRQWGQHSHGERHQCWALAWAYPLHKDVRRTGSKDTTIQPPTPTHLLTQPCDFTHPSHKVLGMRTIFCSHSSPHIMHILLPCLVPFPDTHHPLREKNRQENVCKGHDSTRGPHTRSDRESKDHQTGVTRGQPSDEPSAAQRRSEERERGVSVCVSVGGRTFVVTERTNVPCRRDSGRGRFRLRCSTKPLNTDP